MASLISANEFENLYSQQRDAQQPTLMQGGSLNPAMMLQAAHQLRQQQAQRSMTPPGGPPGAGPMAQHLATTKYKAALGKAYGLGDEDMKDFKDVMDDPSVTPQMMHQIFAAKAATAKGHHAGGTQQPVDPNAGTMSIAAAGQNPAQQQTREAMFGAHQQGLNPQAVPGGFKVGGLGPQQQQADPAAGMLNAFKGKVPDQMLGAAQQAIQAGVPAATVYNHLMQTAGKQQPDESGKQRHTEFSENKSVLDELNKQETELRKRAELDPDPNIQKDLQAVVQQQQSVRGRMEQSVSPQQGQQQQAGPVQIQSPDEASKLPAGSQFVFNGHIYRKK